MDLNIPRYVFFWNRPHWLGPALFEGCDAHCQMIEDSQYYNQSHAVIFHVPSLDVTYLPIKYPDHVWVAYVTESPERMRNSYDGWRYVFNWTMSYRRDSDILAMTGAFYTKRQTYRVFRSGPSGWNKKVRDVAWMVSNCRTSSRREEYVKQLQRHLSIHTYGKCGNYSCPRPPAPRDDCLNVIDQRYKFYLAMENSFCMDYLTEKVFNVYRLSNVIPVVRGGANYDLFLPPGSYISASNFHNATSLAKHIKRLLNKKEITFQPFIYKNFYGIRPNDRHYFCDLCKRLHAVDLSERFYHDFDSWLRRHNGYPLCSEPRDV